MYFSIISHAEQNIAAVTIQERTYRLVKTAIQPLTRGLEFEPARLALGQQILKTKIHKDQGAYWCILKMAFNMVKA